jgi:hypothetical protein
LRNRDQWQLRTATEALFSTSVFTIINPLAIAPPEILLAGR